MFDDSQVSLFDFAAAEPAAVAPVSAPEPAEAGDAAEAVDYAAGQVEVVTGERISGWFDPPSGEVARAEANLAAVRIAVEARGGERVLSDDERRVLAKWSGWGALPDLFAPEPRRLGEQAEELRGLLTDEEWSAARESTINAHYTAPAVAEAVWDVAARLGWSGGRVLEPGCGNGVFFGSVPPASVVDLVGVEMDSLSAEIGGLLHQGSARVVRSDFRDFREGGFGLAVGNVPFAGYKPYDPVESPTADLSLHNYMIYKSLRLLEPGGLAILVTSSYTMSSKGEHQRQRLATLGKFLGAVRLPNDAFKAHAGTEVVTDVVMFQRRSRELSLEEVKAAGQDLDGGWTRQGYLEVLNEREGHKENVQGGKWFEENPDMVLGRVVIPQGGGMYYGGQSTVESDGSPLEPKLRAALFRLADGALERGEVGAVPRGSVPEPEVGAAGKTWNPPDWALEGSLHDDGANGFWRVEKNLGVPYTPAAKDVAELRAVLAVRDAMGALLRAESNPSAEDAALDALRADLNMVYDSYSRRFGEVSRGGRGSGLGGFSADPSSAAVRMLEQRSVTGVINKADIFKKRTVFAESVDVEASTAEEALAASLTRHGSVDVEYMQSITDGFTDDELTAGCFLDPESGGWMPADTYLSGHIPTKLDAARDAAVRDGRFAANVAALEEALPPPVPAGDIGVRLGVGWVEPDEVAEFIADTLDIDVEDIDVSYANPGSSAKLGWSVRKVPGKTSNWSEVISSEWGIDRYDAFRCVEAALRNKVVRLEMPGSGVDGKKKVVDKDATEQVAEKMEAWQQRFREWLFFDDPGRADRIAARYNRLITGWKAPSFDGSWVATPPGLATAGKDLRTHQRDAVARILLTGDCLLAHKVGAGKTWTMVTAAMMMRKAGLAQKPLFVLPNHLVEQFRTDFLEAYPNARVLCPTEKELSTGRGGNRRGFASKCAFGEWDAVLMKESDFDGLPVAFEVRRKRAEEELKELKAAYDSAKSEGAMNVKQVEQAMKVHANRMEKELHKHLTKGQTDAVTFEMLGVDYLFVDEAHLFKNLRIVSTNSELFSAGSARAVALEERLKWLRETFPNKGVVCLSTGTPVANKLAEAYVMQRFVQPEVLKDAGIKSFDHWANSFGKVRTRPEMTASGSGYEMRSTFSEYQNLPELVRLLSVNADVKVGDDIQLDLPNLLEEIEADRFVEIPKNFWLEEYVEGLIKRWQSLGTVPPDEDNALKILGDARKAAIDLRLLDMEPGPEYEDDYSKVAVVGKRVFEIWDRTKTREYRDLDTGETSGLTGSCQMVFCDIGVPGGATEFCVYDALRDDLAERGIPAEKIRYVHEAKTDQQKQALFKECRDGKVSVLIGSTERCGTGMNIQNRLAALHHMDVPWRPADLEQREGRILRQGNQNDDVRVIRYVAQGSFDVFSWQTIERKALFIGQLLEGRHGAMRDTHGYDDEGDRIAMDAAKMKAIAAGDPTMLRYVEVMDQRKKLERRREQHTSDQTRLSAVKVAAEATKARLEHVIAASADMVPPGGGDWADHNWTATFDTEWGRTLKEVYEERAESYQRFAANATGVGMRTTMQHDANYYRMMANVLSGETALTRDGRYVNRIGSKVGGSTVLNDLLAGAGGRRVRGMIEGKGGTIPRYSDLPPWVAGDIPLTDGVEIGDISGQKIYVWPHLANPRTGYEAFIGFGKDGGNVAAKPLAAADSRTGRTLIRMLSDTPNRVEKFQKGLHTAISNLESAGRRLGRPFPEEEELRQAILEENRLSTMLAIKQGVDIDLVGEESQEHQEREDLSERPTPRASGAKPSRNVSAAGRSDNEEDDFIKIVPVTVPDRSEPDIPDTGSVPITVRTVPAAQASPVPEAVNGYDPDGAADRRSSLKDMVEGLSAQEMKVLQSLVNKRAAEGVGEW